MSNNVGVGGVGPILKHLWLFQKVWRLFATDIHSLFFVLRKLAQWRVL